MVWCAHSGLCTFYDDHSQADGLALKRVVGAAKPRYYFSSHSAAVMMRG